jgi:hypothetical protein
MCISVGVGLALMAASTIASAAMAPKPPKAPDNSAFNAASIQQAKKAADTSSTDAIKTAKKAGGTTKQDTLLTGGGLDDSELNLSSNLLA